MPRARLRLTGLATPAVLRLSTFNTLLFNGTELRKCCYFFLSKHLTTSLIGLTVSHCLVRQTGERKKYEKDETAAFTFLLFSIFKVILVSGSPAFTSSYY